MDYHSKKRTHSTDLIQPQSLVHSSDHWLGFPCLPSSSQKLPENDRDRLNSKPVTVLPSLCGSRMCWSAQDVLCQQVYFSTSLPSVFPSQQILLNPIVETLLSNIHRLHVLNKSSRVKEKKTLPKQRITSMPVTVLPCLCGSRMCWSAQDVLCQQVYFSTSLPSVFPSQQILLNPSVETLLSNIHRLHMLNKSSQVKEKKTLPNQRITSMPVTVLPCLCGSRMCWSAQDVLCQQVYFSTSLPSVFPSQ